jgi:hypothetical protein
LNKACSPSQKGKVLVPAEALGGDFGESFIKSDSIIDNAVIIIIMRLSKCIFDGSPKIILGPIPKLIAIPTGNPS